MQYIKGLFTLLHTYQAIPYMSALLELQKKRHRENYYSGSGARGEFLEQHGHKV